MFVLLHTKVYIEVDDNADVEDVAYTFDAGAESSMRDFPKGDVIQVDVDNAEVLTPSQVKDLGFED